MIKAVFFDFDGTIADTFPIVVRTANALLAESGKPPIPDPEALREYSALELVSKLGIPLWKLPFLKRKALGIMANEMERAQPFNGMQTLINILRHGEYVVGIITTNEESVVQDFLQRNGMQVDFISSVSAIFGKGKAIRSLAKDYNLAPEEVAYIGDEIRDIEASKAADVRCISVTWGFNSRQALKKYNDLLATKPQDILTILDKLNGRGMAA